MLKTELQKGFMFAQPHDGQLDRVAQHAVRVQLDEGEMLFRQNDPAERFYLLLRGQVKLFRLGPSGNEKVIEIVTPVSTFAEALMFLDHPTYPVGAAGHAARRSDQHRRPRLLAHAARIGGYLFHADG